jgi:hypothetical protein
MPIIIANDFSLVEDACTGLVDAALPPIVRRHGSVKRVAAGVGEGATAVQFIHQYLGSGER